MFSNLSRGYPKLLAESVTPNLFRGLIFIEILKPRLPSERAGSSG